MLPKPTHRFEEWFETPLPEESSDSRFTVRRAHPSEFERQYDLVDEVFGVRRPRAVFDWLYRKNPAGVAHCWVVEEKATGTLVCQTAYWPWPLARGLEPRLGYLAGDSVVVPDRQRGGIAELRRKVSNGHPLDAARMRLGWPNEKSLARLRKHGHVRQLAGPVLEGVLHLGKRLRRARRSWLHSVRYRRFHVEEVTSFDAGFDALTRRTMAWEGFWAPHDTEFLNWRYFAHPTRCYRALAALDGDDPAGYCVLRTLGRTALLMEFAAPETGAAPRLLLRRALEAAREADCRKLAFYAPPRWRHWPSFRSAGFTERSSARTLSVRGTPDPDAYRIEAWQLLPGDCDDA